MTDNDLYRAARLGGGEEPPAALDARILAAAHEAVKPAAPRRVSWVARFVPYSLAAVAILGVAISLRVIEEDQPRPPMPAERPAAAGDAAAERAAPSGAPVPPPAAAPAVASPSAMTPATGSNIDSLADRAPAAPALARELPGAQGEAKAKSGVAPAGSERGKAVFAAPQVPTQSFVADPAGAAGGSAEVTTEAEAHRREEPAARRAKTAPTGEMPARTLSQEAAPARDAESWLAEIRRQLEAGERERAYESLRAFKRVYPQHPLPPELRALEAR